MIRIQEIVKRYDGTLALDHLSLEVPQGAVYGLLGPNGAGKSTLLHLIMGFILPTSGQIDRAGLPTARIGFLPERTFYPPRFAIGEYLMLLGRLGGLGRGEARQAVAGLLAQLGLEGEAGRRLGTCSRGMLQRTGLAQALLADPPLVILDEPTLGLDPGGQRFIREQVTSMHESGRTVILSSHQLEQVLRVCTHVAVLNKGRLVRSGPLDEILAPRRQVKILARALPPSIVPALTTLCPGIAITERQLVLEGDDVACKGEVLRALIEAGVDVQHLSEQHATLEEVYLEATGE
ncbi:MAG: ABC transporter ATP-binding protein [Anaerolineae bacterium]|nr:ABC transporter ATP-binding protein [Anaerolineae bacterium]